MSLSFIGDGRVTAKSVDFCEGKSPQFSFDLDAYRFPMEGTCKKFFSCGYIKQEERTCLNDKKYNPVSKDCEDNYKCPGK